MNKQSPHLEINLKGLSDREKQITYLVAKGKLRKEIAHDCCIAMDTVKAHLRNIMEKTGASSNVELAVKAVLSVSNPRRIFLSTVIVTVMSLSLSPSLMENSEWRSSRRSNRKNQRTHVSRLNYRTQISKQC